MLNLRQLQAAIAAARQRFDLLRKKYPDLKARLVLSTPDGQTKIDSKPEVILIEFPTMVVDDRVKAGALELLPRQSYLSTGEKLEGLPRKFHRLAARLKYHDHCRIELRFDDLNFDLVARLQTDDLVDRHLTPQTKASIRIVLGTLAQLKVNL